MTRALGALALAAALAGCPASVAMVTTSPQASPSAGAIARLTPEAMLALGEPYLVVDVRNPDVYDQEHAEGAVNAPLSKLESGDDQGLPKDKALVLYCTCPTEASSLAAGRVLRTHGYTKLYALAGGLAAWKNAGLKTVKRS